MIKRTIKPYRIDEVDRQRTTITIDGQILREGINMGINISEIAEEAIALKLDKRKAIKSIKVISAMISSFKKRIKEENKKIPDEMLELLEKIQFECGQSY